MATKLNSVIHVLQGGNEQVTSPFGKRSDPVTGKSSTHNGIDLIGGDGSRIILAAADGTVTYTRNRYSGRTTDGSAGNYIRINHGDYDTVYYHLKQHTLLVKNGEKVKAGQAIATMGDTGHTTGVHLHFGIEMKKGGWVDPATYLCGQKSLPGMPTYKGKSIFGNRGDKPTVKWGKVKHDDILELQNWFNKNKNARILADGISGDRTLSFAQKFKVGYKTDGDIPKWVQKRLKTLGYYDGLVDGEPRSLTVSAIKAFEKDYGLTQDEIISDNDWYYLLAVEV